MVFKGLFGKKKLPQIDFASIGVDMHSHLIPGIDDGAQELSDTLTLMEGLKALGFQKLITTPHTLVDQYPNTKEGILSAYKELMTHELPLPLEVSSEYYFDYHFKGLVEQKSLIPFGENYLLFEFPMAAKPHGVKEVLFDLLMDGYKPVLAHPERYLYWTGKVDTFEDYVDRGVKMQINLMSLVGYYGKRPQKMAEALIDKGLVHFVGTDLHHAKQLPVLEQCQNSIYLKKLIDSGRLLNSSL